MTSKWSVVRTRALALAAVSVLTMSLTAGLLGVSSAPALADCDTGPGWGPQCGIHRFAPGEVVEVPFAKSGGYDTDGPMAEFWQEWFADSELRLPEGRYEITAYLHHGARGSRCGGPWETPTASVSIEVVPDPATTEAEA